MLTYDDLVNDMKAGCKPRADWRMGLEYERFAFAETSGGPLPYDGVPGIRVLLESFAARDGWQIVYEGDNPIALQKDMRSVSLEPGGQVEFSGSPLATTAEAQAEMDAFLQAMGMVADELGIGFLTRGFHPVWTRADVQWMPKGRYAIMRPYMERVGMLGVDMMGRTCGAQINLDFSSEADMVRKFRVAIGLQPVVVALMANSARVDGRDSGYASYRAHVWTGTDAARCGFLPFVFEDDMSFARYVDYALDVPLYFIKRGEGYIDVAGESFRAFMDGTLPGHEGLTPTLADWRNHLGTLFPDVRLKHYLEFRGPDSHTPEMVYAMMAFWTGLIYDNAALDKAHDLLRRYPALIAQSVRTDIPRDGLRTALPDTPWPHICALAADMVDLAAEGLMRQPQEGPRAAALLEPFRRKISENCPTHRKSAV